MYPAIRSLGDVDFSEFAGAATTQTLASALGSPHCCASSRSRRRPRPTGHALQRMQRKLVARQHFARGFAQPDRTHCEDERCGVENKSDNEDDPTRNQSYGGPLEEHFEGVGRHGMQIHLEVPAQRFFILVTDIVTT